MATKRRKTHRENTEIAAMIRRMIRAHAGRVAYGDENDLAELIGLQADIAEAITVAVRHLHYDQEFSWSTIAAATGTTKQNAQQRWGL